MTFLEDNKTILILLSIIIVLQILAIRYYVASSIEDAQSRNNKKIIKKITGEINTTFDQYIGQPKQIEQNYQQEYHPSQNHRDIDSINDPADNDE